MVVISNLFVHHPQTTTPPRLRVCILVEAMRLSYSKRRLGFWRKCSSGIPERALKLKRWEYLIAYEAVHEVPVGVSELWDPKVANPLTVVSVEACQTESRHLLTILAVRAGLVSFKIY